MSLIKVASKENALVLNTPKRNELLKDGLSESKSNKCQILGRGAYGTVFKGIYHEHAVAVKIIRRCAVSTMHNEAHILNWKHKNIVRLIKLESTLECGLLIMERPNGLCLQRIVDTIALPLLHRTLITLDILAALRYCHSQRILHLDIKPPNILVALGISSIDKHCRFERQYICKLCDFGSSIKLDEPTINKCSARGTLRYMSPEALRAAPLSSAADIYSLGITMWQLQARRLPYQTLNCNESIAYQVVKHELRPDNYALLEALKLSCDYLKKFKSPLDVVLSTDLCKKANSLARRNLNFESAHGRVHKRSKQRKQARLAQYFVNPSVTTTTFGLEYAYSELYKDCWLSQPELRLSASQLKKRLELILSKC
ncbi:proto-oncogene serine/threonine-protein kinase mos [Drosophila busckii]|uniref:proto-oncogene serine/threonine-protein kinase mos n=1 Tax=Drosophila busckii TaxID=30019 RepID=UPI00083F40AA|nr:proto-oncogene serine/threonine-protein kinase mos [Drosophila busckii]